MIFELARPGVEHAQQAALHAQLGERDVAQRAGAFAEERAVEFLRVRADHGAQLFGHGEGDEEVRHRQKPGLLSRGPALGVGAAALVAGAMTARMIGEVHLAAGAMKELAAPRGRAATQESLHGGALRGRDASPELRDVRGPVTAEDLRQGRHGRQGGR